MMTAPQYKTNTAAMSGTSCRAACSKQGLSWAGLTGNSTSHRVTLGLELTQFLRQIASVAKTKSMALSSLSKPALGSVLVSHHRKVLKPTSHYFQTCRKRYRILWSRVVLPIDLRQFRLDYWQPGRQGRHPYDESHRL
jgi:hypothetical protein